MRTKETYTEITERTTRERVQNAKIIVFINNPSYSKMAKRSFNEIMESHKSTLKSL